VALPGSYFIFRELESNGSPDRRILLLLTGRSAAGTGSRVWVSAGSGAWNGSLSDLLTPPKGLEAGYVPIFTRQSAAE
jgi:hypothetical protein